MVRSSLQPMWEDSSLQVMETLMQGCISDLSSSTMREKCLSNPPSSGSLSTETQAYQSEFSFSVNRGFTPYLGTFST